jgi:16S rRNA processing protein RimM
VLLRLDGIDTREAAESLRGCTISVDRGALPPLEPGEYYLCDLVGMRALGPSGDIGRVVEVQVHPTVDAVVIEMDDGKRVEQPLTEPWVERVDVDEGVLVLATTDGMV